MRKSNAFSLEQRFNLLGHIYNPLKQIFLANEPEKVIAKVILKMGFHFRVLVVGGGADNTVSELFFRNKCTTVTQVDISSVLTKKAQIRLKNKNAAWFRKAKFITSPFLEYESGEKYDAIISPFYLDLFTEWEVKENIEKMKTMLPNGGLIYVIDFANSSKQSTSNKWLIEMLYLLFYPITEVYRKEVPNYRKLFNECGFVLVDESAFSNSLYQNLIFKKV